MFLTDLSWNIWIAYTQDLLFNLNITDSYNYLSGNTVKTLRSEFSELKMQAVFTRKNKRLSRLYDRKFTPSYTTSRDGITCPVKSRSHSHCAYSDRRLSNTLAILFTRRLCRGSVCLVVQCQTEHRKYSENPHTRGHQKRFVYRHFWNVCAFVMWILWVSGLNFGLNFHSENRWQV